MGIKIEIFLNKLNLFLITVVVALFITNINIINAVSTEKELEIRRPGDIAINTNNGNVYVLGSSLGGREVIIIDGKTDNITGTIPVIFNQSLTIGDFDRTAGIPTSISFNKLSELIYIPVNSIYTNITNPNDTRTCANYIEDDIQLVCNVIVINTQTNEVIEIIDNKGFDLQELTIDENNDRIFLVNGNFIRQDIHELGNISVIDGKTNEVIDTIPVGDSPRGIAFDKNNDRIYVTNQLSDNISVIDLKNNNMTTLSIDGGRPLEILFNPFNSYIYFSNGFENEVSIINPQTNKVIDTIPVGDIANALSSNLQNGDVYVAKGFKNEISVIDGKTNEVIDTIPVGNNPVSIAFNNINNKLYVSNLLDNTLSILHLQE